MGHCSHCHKIWTLETRQGLCQWCGNLAVCQSSTAKPRHIKSSRKRKQRQAPSGDRLDAKISLPSPREALDFDFRGSLR